MPIASFPSERLRPPGRRRYCFCLEETGAIKGGVKVSAP